jgi:hypothetical protein
MPDSPDIELHFACNDQYGNGQGWAGMASLRVEGDRVCTLEHHFRDLAISNHPETGSEPPIEVLTNVVINDMHGEAYMLLAGEHFGLAAWENMVGNVFWRSALLAHPDQLFEALQILMDEEWYPRNAPWDFHKHWAEGYVNADDIHPAIDAHYRMDESTDTAYA